MLFEPLNVLDRLACLSDAYPLTIHKHRTRPQVLYLICRCRECNRLADHLVPLLHPQLDESQMYRRRPRTQCHHTPRLQPQKPLQIKTIHIWPERNHPVCIKGRLRECYDFFSDVFILLQISSLSLLLLCSIS